MTTHIKLGVSACLLGENVRYDGGHKLDCSITGTLGCCFNLVPVCPEVECGLTIPREAMRLEGYPDNPRLIAISSRSDKTDQMLGFTAVKLRELEDLKLCGFIFKERSPSCGLTMVPLHRNGASAAFTAGLFANEVARCFPMMPLEEAERLNDTNILKNFIERVFLYLRKKDAQ